MNTLINKSYLTATLLVIGYLFTTNTIAFAQSQTRGITVITVGPGGSTCHINSGSTKIQDAGFSDIRIVDSGIYNENIVIDDIDINITGGSGSFASHVRTNLLAFDTIITPNQADDDVGICCRGTRNGK